MANENIEIISANEGGEATIAAMNEYSRQEIGRKTFLFVRHLMRDPDIRERIQARAAEIRAAQTA